MALPNTDPSLPSNPAPVFADTNAARGDEMRANNNKIWGNLTYLETEIGNNWLRTIYGDNAYGSTLSTNLNAITKSGFYTCYNTATGIPDSGSSWFVIHQNSEVGVVSAYQRATSFSSPFIVYERSKVASAWGTWRESGAEPTGSEKMFFGDTAPRGWLIEDGKSLALSGGNYNGTAYYNLYAHIWDLVNRGAVPTTYLSTTKGASASADWAAGKKIYIPNMQAVSAKGTGSQTINTRSKTGAGLGAVEEDRVQTIQGDMDIAVDASIMKAYEITSAGTGAWAMKEGASNAIKATNFVMSPYVRNGATTRDNTMGKNYIIKL